VPPIRRPIRFPPRVRQAARPRHAGRIPVRNAGRTPSLVSPLVLASAVRLGILVLPAFRIFVGPALVAWLWNLTLPNLFAWPRLTYWQAFRVVLLALTGV